MCDMKILLYVDIDGDHMCCVKDKRIIDAIPEQFGIKYDAGLKGQSVVFNNNLLLRYFRNNCKVSEVGVITTYNSVWNDIYKNGRGDKEKIRNIIYGLGFLQGWEIDKAKTGAVVEIPDELKIEYKPHWLYLSSLFRDNAQDFIENGVDKNDIPENVYHSDAPMGVLCDYVLERADIMLRHTTQTVDFTGALASKVDVNSLVGILPTVRELEKVYRKEFNGIFNKYTDTKEDKFKIKIELNDLNEKYRKLMLSLPGDNLSKAVACYKVCYSRQNHESNSKAFAWGVMFDELLEVIERMNNGRKLVKLPSTDEEIEQVYVNSKNVLFINNNSYRNVNIPSGTYNVFQIKNENYIYVKRNKVQEYKEVKIEDKNKIYQVTLGGFDRQGLTALEVKDMLLENKLFTIKNVDEIFRVIVNNKIVSGVLGTSILEVVGVENTNCEIVSIESPIYEPKRINDKTVWFDKENNLAIRKTLDITFKVISTNTEDKYYIKEKGVNTQENISSFIETDTQEESVVYDDFTSHDTTEFIPCDVSDFTFI